MSEWINIKKSSNISAYRWDEGTCDLDIRFHSGGGWRYPNVDRELLSKFLSANSAGAFLHSHIKNLPGARALSAEELTTGASGVPSSRMNEVDGVESADQGGGATAPPPGLISSGAVKTDKIGRLYIPMKTAIDLTPEQMAWLAQHCTPETDVWVLP